MTKSRKNLSQEQIKIRILAYLYNRGTNGANSYTIQHRTLITSQESNRFRSFLEDLFKLGYLDELKVETSGTRERTNYIITLKGKRLVEQYRTSLLTELFGSVDDLFH